MLTKAMKILNTLRLHIQHSSLIPTRDMVVAYSGGIDSHVLLHALSRLRPQFGFTLHAIHIHHGLSAAADQWQQHCKQVCDTLAVQFQTAKVDVPQTARTSLEAVAREQRYKKITELAPANAQVLLAQHQDDQLETFLLQLKRGAGPKGLSAMAEAWTVQHGDSKSVAFFRPLLAIAQQDIVEYAQQHQLNWCEDESNKNTEFERNFLRHDVLPVLQSRWPELAKSVSRSAHLCAQQQTLLDEVCADKLGALQTADNSLMVQGLLKLSANWLQQVVRYWLSLQGIQSPSLAVLERLQPDVLEAAEDAKPILQWQGWQFRRFNQQLYVLPIQSEIQPVVLQWTGQESLALPDNIGVLHFAKGAETLNDSVSLSLDDGDISISLGNYSKRFTPANSAHSKPLKQWFKLWQVPPWKRDKVVQIIQNNKIIALLIEGQWQQATPVAGTKTVTVSFSQ
ncbi:tRNA lysidine(34) synthetase TilS [Paraglaciecola aquimarina]|uniref:tRNA(Ile)-lysidine synthase n=1 Tax=Paraglaciecola aquimarina TaxID=1235557 RepID=A0ABU3SX20_9ALTE|nr:tRNA lysidine(34) synthetase TilS [Paraglaciecola aquimarina]MDU0354570.1 tRNA lysidine(34) synthetase TilS [Paraglaciecola aquimarina]